MIPAHVFLTRYNLPTPGVESLIRAQEGWLRERTELFERWTVPSVRAQQGEDISWIVYFDPASPDWLKAKIDAWASEGLLTPIFREAVSPDELVADIRRVVGRGKGVVITSNLDNDDGLACDFVAQLRAAPIDVAQARQALYLVRGLVLSGDRVHLQRDPDNAFCAVREDLSEMVGCWYDWHNRLGRHMGVVRVEGTPGWLQVIHGKNVSNRVRGVMVSPRAHRGHFAGLLDELPEPSRAELWRDRLVGDPVRRGRDFARGHLREALVGLLGQGGFNQLKLKLGRVRSRLMKIS